MYIPYIGLLDNNKKYKLQIDDNTYIKFEGNIKIMSNKWYIKNILQNYNKIFNVNNMKIYIQIFQKNI